MAMVGSADLVATLFNPHCSRAQALEDEHSQRVNLRSCLSRPPPILHWKCSFPRHHQRFAKPISASVGTSSTIVLESEAGISYEKLRELLESAQWQLADEETRRLIIVLAGENAVRRNYVFFSEVAFIPESDLRTIDQLWRYHSGGRFGYSVQRRVWKRSGKDFTEFFKKVGWMRLLESENSPNQYTYRSFPSEFQWELGNGTPEGHLPLTNALRGVQLLSSILTHPAFDFADDELLAPTSSSDSAAGRVQQLQPKLNAKYYTF